MGASIARKRIRLGPRVLRHQLVQVCASGCCNGSLFYFIYLFIFTLLGVIIKAGPPLEAILVIFGRRALIFFVWKLLEKNEKWCHFCAHAQWWSPWRRKNVEKGHLPPSNLTFLIIAIDRNGFRRMKEEGLIYKSCLRFFNFYLGTWLWSFKV